MADDSEGWQETSSKKSHRKERREESYNENEMEEEIPDFSDAEDYVDDVTDEELLGDLLKKKPQEADGIDSVVVVDGIPQVGPERQEKLSNVVRKIFTKFGKIVTEHYPMIEGENKTKGYIFLEFQNPEQAQAAVTNTNGYKLDKQHTFCVNLFSDFEKYAHVPDNWEPPEAQPFKDYGNLRQWLLDTQCNDQFSTIHESGERTSIWSNSCTEPSLVEERARWTETYVRWSPQGTYLATFHQRGIALWGGENFKQINRFSHDGVQLIDFSPCEKYMVTFSPLPDNRDDPQAVIIWDIRSGIKKRGFHCQNASVWPIFKWNHEGKYFARMADEAISVYETPSFGLLDKKSMKIKGLKDFAWSPTDNMISYWKGEEGDRPATVTLVAMPSREVLSLKNLFAVADCKMHWQKSGDYLCVKLDRYKSKKEEKDTIKYQGITHNFNVFRIREKQIPVDTIEIKDNIMAFAWEPVGNKFALIHGETPRICVSFYNVKKSGSIELIKTLDKRQANHLFWSPNGKFIVLAGLRSMSGVLEFIDTTDMTIMAQAEHFMATDVEWDPTGRYVGTAVSWWGHKVDNAFWIWNFQGRLLHKQPMERFCQLLWRPRPPSLLTPAKVQDLKKNMKKYNSIFAAEDKRRETKASKEQLESRRVNMEEWQAYREQCEAEYEAEKDQRLAMRKGIDTDEIEADTDAEEETVEFLVDVTETLLDEE